MAGIATMAALSTGTDPPRAEQPAPELAKAGIAGITPPQPQVAATAAACRPPLQDDQGRQQRSRHSRQLHPVGIGSRPPEQPLRVQLEPLPGRRGGQPAPREQADGGQRGQGLPGMAAQRHLETAQRQQQTQAEPGQARPWISPGQDE